MSRLTTERLGLERVDSQLVAALKVLPLVVVIFDHEGLELGRTQGADALLQGGASSLLPRADLERVVHDAIALGVPHREIVHVFGPPATSLSIRAFPYPWAGAAGVTVTIEDLGEQKRDEVARRDFLTNLSHELRTPVGAVALLAETIADEDDPETIRHLAGRLEFEARRLGSTLQDVVSLSRLENASLSQRASFDFGDLVRQCVATRRSSADLLGIELRIASFEDGLTVVADRGLISTAVGNLIENAVKYSDKGEPVIVSVVRSALGEFAELVVEDQGIGIPIRDRQRIFERFYRVDRARRRDTGGTGLGLAIVRHVAVSHDGDVDVDSIEGEGSTFRFRLPLAQPGDVAITRNDAESGPS